MPHFTLKSTITLRIEQTHSISAFDRDDAMDAYHADEAKLIAWSTGELVGDIELGDLVEVEEPLVAPVDPRDELIALIAKLSMPIEGDPSFDGNSAALSLLIRRARQMVDPS